MLRNIYKLSSISVILLLVPHISSAVELGGTTTLFTNLYNLVTQILTPLVFTLALLMFFWGMVKYIKSAGTEKDEGKKIMIWGIIALFVMSSVWGLVTFIQRELNIDNVDSVRVPTITL
jgi:TRAP-type C4-dicarboxylate transport system permease small subunit